MTEIPRRIIEPLKLALAIAIIYAISFYMGWEKPYWATVSAVSVNLLSSGLTIHRGLIRTLGTAVGGFLGLAAIGIFPQERWAYMILITVVLFIFGYKSTGKKEPYFYLIVLITFMVIMAVVQQADYTDSGNAFSVVMLRVTQTLMGSVVMVLIMVYVFPYRTIDEFEDLVRLRWSTQQRMHAAYRGMLFGEPPAEDTKELRLGDSPLLHFTHFKLHGAEQDSFEMLEVGHDWHHFLDLSAAQFEAMEALRQGVTEAKDLDLSTYLPNLAAVCAELDRRFEQTGLMLNKSEPTEIPQHIGVSLDEEATRALPKFQEAAVRVIRAQLEKLEEVSLSLFDGVAKIRMFEGRAGAHGHGDHGHGDHGHGDHGHGDHGHGVGGFGLDPFRLRTTAAFILAVWISFLAWVYVYDIPRGSLFPCFVVITASILNYRPEVNPLQYSVAWLVGAVAAAPCYLLIMQYLSGHLELSIMVVIGVFLLQYYLYPRVHPVPRIFATIGFTIVIDAENHMHYSLELYIHTVLWMAGSLFVMLVARFALVPRRPDVLFMQSLDRFFRHADFLLSAQDAEGRPDRSLMRRLRSVFYQHSILEEADRLTLFAGQVSPITGQTTYQMLRETDPALVQELIRCVYALGHRVEALVEAREAWASNRVDSQVMAEKRDWHRIMQEWFRRRPGLERTTGPAGDLPARLAELETRIDEAFARIAEGELSTEEYENFFQRLGNYRGLTEAAVTYAEVASRFDWPRWRETRF